MLRYTNFVTSTGNGGIHFRRLCSLFRQEIYAGVSFLDSFQNSATFLLASGKVVFQYLSVTETIKAQNNGLFHL